jgi:hypothetical protein
VLFAELKVGDRVEDTWYPLLGVAVVESKGKWSVRLKWPDRTLVYDRAHCRFLKRADICKK